MVDLVRRGRVRGLGATLVTQRPATLNKDILTQAEVLIALRMTGPRDVAAIDEWVRLHAEEDQAREVKSSLASLPVGTAWVWSPGWLGLLERVQVRTPRTFDSSATPRPGQSRPAAQAMAPVDLAALGEAIAATVERAREEDPARLRATITDLRRQLQDRPAAPPVRVEVPVLDAQTLQALHTVTETWETATRELRTVLQAIADSLDATGVRFEPPRSAAPAPAAPQPRTRPAPPTPAPQHIPLPTTGEAGGVTATAASLPKAHRAILTVLAQHGRRSTTQVALLTGYSSTSGGFRNALSSLRTSGFIEGRGDVEVTPAGLRALGAYQPLPTGRALIAWWQREQLGKAESAVLGVLVEGWPAAVPVQDIAESTGYSATSGGFRNALSRLRSLNLATGRELTVSATLME